MAHSLRSPRPLTLHQRVEASLDTWHGGRRLPVIRVRGEWLEENGFVAGARVVLSVERGHIVITLTGEVR